MTPGSVSPSHPNATDAIVVEVVDVVVVDVDDVEVEVDVVVVEVDVEDVSGEMIKVTGMPCGLLVAPSPETVMIAEYVPAGRPERFAVAVKAVGEFPDDVPEEGDSMSHSVVVLTLHLNGPFPMFEMLTV